MKNRRRIRDKTNDERRNICNNDVNEVQIENNWRSKALHKGKRRNKVMSWINCCVTHIQNSCSNGIAEIKIYHTANRTQVNYIDPIGDCKRHIKYFKKWTLSIIKICCCNIMHSFFRYGMRHMTFSHSITNSWKKNVL